MWNYQFLKKIINYQIILYLVIDKTIYLDVDSIYLDFDVHDMKKTL